jgi:2-polyprenyl-6-methoxyphenol hydroxylase-like FAD-dependent oxidoreductase
VPQVVIVGAGPAGAALAYLLARRGIEVTLLERHTDFAREFRGEGLMPSGVDAVAQMGLGAALDAIPQVRVAHLEIYRGGRRLARIALTPERLGTAGPRIVSQPAMLEMLVAEAAHHPSFRLMRGVTVRDLIHEGERVRGVRADSTDGASELRAELVIATDGRASVLRRRAGLHEERAPQEFDIVWCKVPLPDFLADRTTGRAYLGRGHAALVFPSYDGRLQIGWIIDKGSFGDIRARGIPSWLEEMARHVSPDLAAHLRDHASETSHPFLLDVICDRLVRWTAPGLLLLGDAAHPMSPVGAQGINIALRDALVAANHLVPVLLRGAPAAEIDAAARAVQAERMPEVEAIQLQQQAPPRILFGRTWTSRLVVGVLLPLVARIGMPGLRNNPFLRRFTNGVTEVRLQV